MDVWRCEAGIELKIGWVEDLEIRRSTWMWNEWEFGDVKKELDVDGYLKL